jgi:tRNA threonylcarbamoyladenosine biosynthesis protein TsaB
LATLLIDTCLDACQVAAVANGQRLAARSEPMRRGHQERVATMTAEVMAEAGLDFADLTRIAVTLGPGSFTGIRVGLAFARGLRLATQAQIVGIGTLNALAASARRVGRRAGVVDARRGQVYLQIFDGNEPLDEAEVLPFEQAVARLRDADDGALNLAGPGAHLFEEILGADRIREIAAADLDALTRLAELAKPLDDPRPLYLRAPDIRSRAE